MPQLLPPVPLAAQQLVVVLRAKRILYEAAEVAAGRLVAIRRTTPDGSASYGPYPARVAAYARQLLGTPALPCDGMAVGFTTQGRTETGHYTPEGVLAARRHMLRRIARNAATMARPRAQEGGCAHA